MLAKHIILTCLREHTCFCHHIMCNLHLAVLGEKKSDVFKMRTTYILDCGVNRYLANLRRSKFEDLLFPVEMLRSESQVCFHHHHAVKESWLKFFPISALSFQIADCSWGNHLNSLQTLLNMLKWWKKQRYFSQHHRKIQACGVTNED